MRFSLSRVSAVLVTVWLLAACGSPQQDEATVDVAGDTVPAVQPVSPAEIERRAEPMTPEEAQERGVVDTTIHVTDEP
jgi:hypothetical protein